MMKLEKSAARKMFATIAPLSTSEARQLPREARWLTRSLRRFSGMTGDGTLAITEAHNEAREVSVPRIVQEF